MAQPDGGRKFGFFGPAKRSDTGNPAFKPRFAGWRKHERIVNFGDGAGDLLEEGIFSTAAERPLIPVPGLGEAASVIKFAPPVHRRRVRAPVEPEASKSDRLRSRSL
jgi:hypothetical protein